MKKKQMTLDVVRLTQELISCNTVIPPGNEQVAAEYVGALLKSYDFRVDYLKMEENRLQVIAEKGILPGVFPVVFTGHFDTVPLGAAPWSVDPFGGEIKDGKLYGRGSTDMKGGLAAMVVAAIEAFEGGARPAGGVRLILTADEELGCRGAKRLTESHRNIGQARGIIVGEPTNNIPAVGHKGGLFLNLTTKGVTAHSSMPHLGENAIYKAARAICAIEKFKFEVDRDSLLGFPTINVGKVFGGMNPNSVPDYAGFTVDVRTTTKVNHANLLKKIKQLLGDEVFVDVVVDLPAVSSEEQDAFVQLVYDQCAAGELGQFPKSLPYLTDGSILQNACHGAPTIILGPGKPELAHQTDEYCEIEKLYQAVEIYKNILKNADF